MGSSTTEVCGDSVHHPISLLTIFNVPYSYEFSTWMYLYFRYQFLAYTGCRDFFCSNMHHLTSAELSKADFCKKCEQERRRRLQRELRQCNGPLWSLCYPYSESSCWNAITSLKTEWRTLRLKWTSMLSIRHGKAWRTCYYHIGDGRITEVFRRYSRMVWLIFQLISKQFDFSDGRQSWNWSDWSTKNHYIDRFEYGLIVR